MNKVKVLFLITKSSWGGAQRYVFDLATNLDKERFEPVVALGGTGLLYDRLREAGLHVTSIKGLGRDISFLKDLWSSFQLAYLICKERPDILHINSSKVGFLGTCIGRICFIKKVIFTAHGWAFNEDRPQWQKLTIKLLQWLTVLFSHTTIVVSNGTKKDMDWPLVQQKMRVIHLGRNVTNFKNRSDARELLAMKVQNNTISLYDHTEDFWIGTIAELHPTKCLNIAIDALALLVTEFPTLRYVIIHDGQERTRLEQQVKNLDLTENVFFTGTLENAAELLPAFDLFVLPSRSEAFGYVLLEAGQAGLPVVASRVGGIPDIITDQENGLLVPPQDAHALAEAIVTLMTNPLLQKELAKRNQEKSLNVSLEQMVKKTEVIYSIYT